MLFPKPAGHRTWQDWGTKLVQHLSTPEVEKPVRLASYEITNLPKAATVGVVIMVTDAGDLSPAYSDGTDWRYFIDGEVVE